MNLIPLVDKLHTDNVGKKAVNIFINHMPANTKEGILLRDAYVGTPIDYELPNYRKTRFQMAVRAKDYNAASTLARNAIVSLTVSDTTLGTMEVKYIRPRTEPIPFPVTVANQFEFLVIFDAVYVIVE